ncbi:MULTISPECIES: phage integrase [Burkholderiaceae]|jgi:integrase|uniref:Integrase family protein n=2 Tax=Burkholderiaceae TaxID=119060 RepID=B2T0X6_PARPJ|nr:MULTISPECIES: tyrosine-type recombinase/integrase [Burkholderiaceae]MDP9546030.1 integrase [Burkholderia cepacia]UTP22412.1 tyrosine-type recombinase/integrase [Burkholderia sp. FXe9]ACD14696.1 integrase family protein [Paraburkholderia phytofirmans PsJN]MBR8391262.1 tyrosine-type recombinase/integrase [Burkholderia cenocepacia]MBR8473721.1 tyrosine-type recombinase/integrase [Burkholderia cenocepacia]
MTIKQVKSGWQVNVQPGGRGAKRLKKTFAKKADAEAWKRHVQAKVQETPEWVPARKDARLLSELVELWYRLHGSGLNSGEDTKRRLLAMCEAMGNPRADRFTADMFAEYRAQRLAAGITANNMNREQAYMRAVFNELKRLKQWKRANPLEDLRAFKIQENELTFLTLPQVRTLLDELPRGRNVHVTLVSMVCLATGARWGEAEGLRISQVRNGVIQFVKTKSSKARAVPISKSLAKGLHAHFRTHGEGERIFGTAWSAFREGLQRAKIVLPKGQLTHVLRHTFASHFMMNGGNILSLQRALGHHSLTMTMRYAHLSPDHLAETRHLNPLAHVELSDRRATGQRGRRRDVMATRERLPGRLTGHPEQRRGAGTAGGRRPLSAFLARISATPTQPIRAVAGRTSAPA